jgi:hypothetical protein
MRVALDCIVRAVKEEVREQRWGFEFAPHIVFERLYSSPVIYFPTNFCFVTLEELWYSVES